MTFEIVEKITAEAKRDGVPVMKDDGMDFLVGYIEKHENIRDILEIGTALGLSAIRMALVRWDMRVDTVESDETMFEKASVHVKEAGLADRVRCYKGDGASFNKETVYDLIFIDGAKAQYRRYLENTLKMARKGTVFVFDNLNFHGFVEKPEAAHNRNTRQMAAKIKKFRTRLLADERFRTDYYPEIGDGIAFSSYKSEPD